MELENKVPEQLDSIKSDNLKALQKLFPSVIKDGQLDLEALKEEIGNFEEVKEEKYDFTWAGKQEAKKKAQETIVARTLNLIEKDSVNPDNTENLYIEGDNLEVLKLLRQNYRGAIKMIYIDPPYNTGNDFVYNDNFKISQEESGKNQGYIDENNQRLQKNSKDSNRFHANWLTMMYPRLKIARDLLSEDGVIFIHIDDNEMENIGKVCNDIFGEENFINIITIKTKIGGVSGSSEGKSLKDVTEFIWAFCKNKNEIFLNPVYNKIPLFERIQDYIDEGKSWKYTSIITKIGDKILLKRDEKNDMNFYGYNILETQSIFSYAKEHKISIEEVYNKFADKIFRTTNAQSSIRQKVIKETKNYKYPIFSCEYIPIKGKNLGQKIEILYKSGSTSEQRNMVMFLSDVVTKENGEYFYLDKITSLWDDIEYNNLTKEGNIEFQNGKKPVKLLQRLINLSTNNNDIVLDFFSGSASTAHAVMQLNAEDGGNRKFIMVQIDEPIKTDTEAYKFLNAINKPTNICEIGKERIRRAGEKIKIEIEENNKKVKDGEELKEVPDIGFKVFRTADTNINWRNIRNISNYTDLPFNEPDRLDFIENYNDKDVVYEVLLHQRDLPLSEKLELLSAIGDRTYLYASSYLVCLETNVTEILIKELANLNPLPVKFIFRDSAFKSDINLKESTFRYLKTLVEKNSGMNKRTYTIEFI